MDVLTQVQNRVAFENTARKNFENMVMEEDVDIMSTYLGGLLQRFGAREGGKDALATEGVDI